MKVRPCLCLLLTGVIKIIILSSCSAIIEPSISKNSVQLEAPVDQYTSPTYTLCFWWDQVDHALTYHLQVVSSTFAAPGGLLLDTVVSGNKFSYNFNPGSYQWRVMAENGASQTAYSSARSFTVGTSSIKQQQVQLGSPANTLLTNQSSIVFQWGNLYGATKYQIEIDTNNFSNENALVLNQTIPGLQLNFTLLKDQVYEWRVKAANDTAEAQWSAIRYFTYDHTPPAQVSLSLPASGQTVSSPVALQWNTVATASKYKLYVFQSDSTTSFNANFPLSLSTNSYNFSQGVSGNKIYWKVSAVDAAGNEGAASPLRSFVLQ